ncbi:MAG: ABC transporter substrate-binding protein [Acidimicrobiales bacterium]
MRARLTGFMMVMAVVAAACGGDGDTTNGQGQSATTQTPPAGEVDRDATIRIAAQEDDWDDNQAEKSSAFAYVLNVNVYEPLIYLNSDYTFSPGLAESWELIEPNTWRFHLREGVKFHDGSDFDADDVIWTWQTRQVDMEGNTLSTVANTLGPDSVTKVDQFTVDFTPVETNLRLPEQIVHPEGSILPEGQHNDTPPYASTGPFKIVDYVPGESVTVERFEDYWGTTPQVRRLEVQFIPDPQARIQALQAGQVDFVIDVPPEAVSGLEADDSIRVVKSPPGRNHLIYINKNEDRVTADPAVREAIALAVDPESYVEVVLEGNGEPGRWMAPPSVLGDAADLVDPVPFDADEARRVLDEAGWEVGDDGIREKDGRTLSLILLGQQEVAETAVTLIESQLEDLGMAVETIQPVDRAARNAVYDQGNGDFDLDLEPPNQNDGNPAFLPVLRMFSKNANTAQFAPGADFDAIAERSLAAKTTEEAQVAAAEMMQNLLNTHHIVVPLAGVFRIYAMETSVQLGDPHPSFTNQVWTSLSKSTG